ncbi:hypothetical protein FSP39_011763 [Pinctada imbricata]|uniref:YqaJ viral recombinase domain-containing protein n=1 Tax=Pinctada imbricata TaxID=66713 RepID=A0AA89C4V5_PINIB|nr:hypothetical protein FSP39_011763 [Pinctada imbricata]
MIPLQHAYKLEPSSDLNVGRFEEVETSENIICKSDNFIDVENLLKGISSRDQIVDVTSRVPPDVIEEIEIRTRGQCENGLWLKARKCRITSSIFHDVSVRRKTTPAEKLVSRIIGKDCETVDTPALRWGRQYENIAKKHYVAHKKLFNKQRVYVQECGLFLCEENAYLGSSPDGVVHNNTTKEKKLLEIKCPYNALYKTVSEACEMSDFCCTFDEESEKICLKPNHRYYSQVQGQMAICKI